MDLYIDNEFCIQIIIVCILGFFLGNCVSWIFKKERFVNSSSVSENIALNGQQNVNQNASLLVNQKNNANVNRQNNANVNKHNKANVNRQNK